jgi:hypothetical protein
MAKRKKPTEGDPHSLAASYLQHELLNETRDYLERGRALQGVSDVEVLNAWVASFEQWFEKRTEKNARLMDDAAAELRLRGVDQPEDRVKSKINTLRTELKRLGPDVPSEGLDRKIDEFLAERKKPKN